jgi:hypothetical protein
MSAGIQRRHLNTKAADLIVDYRYGFEKTLATAESTSDKSAVRRSLSTAISRLTSAGAPREEELPDNDPWTRRRSRSTAPVKSTGKGGTAD